MLLENKRVAVVGGGPGGLTLARLLQLKGATVKVYERDFSAAARVQGSIVDLHFESGLKAIEQAGLMDEFKAHYMPGADQFRIADQHGNICYDERNQATDAGFGDEHFRPEIDRGALRKILLNALQLDTVVWDSQFLSMAQVDGLWELKFKNGTTATADIVIGSDGARSKIRPYVTNIQQQYSGVTIIQGEIDHPERDCPEITQIVNGGNLIVLGDGKSITMQPRGDGGLTFYGSAHYPENWVKTSGIDFTNNEEVYAYLVKFYAGWNLVFFTLFKACTHFVPRPLNYVPSNQTWAAKPNLTLIGDAAHLMPPSGEGVNLAMLDALELSECLTHIDFKDIQTAIAAYELQMRARAAEELQISLRMAEWMHTEGAKEKMVQMLTQHG
jgi:2-polyprenyl-6-methoxyphenol hydroxylase-like FAD-dependent oxidoreductase